MTTFASSSSLKTSPPLFTMFPGPSSLKSGFLNWTNSNNNEEDHPVPPVRPIRHVQHAAHQWAERSTVVAPGYVVTSTTATVSEWSQFSTSSEVSRSSSQQFQTVRTQSTSGAQPALTSAQYLDDLKLPTEELDLGAQLGKGCIGRKGSLGGRRPPTIRTRRSSQGSLMQQFEQEQPPAEMEQMVPVAPRANGSIHSEPTIKSSSSGRTPPPRPPPPVFTRHSDGPLSATSTTGTDSNAVSRSESPPTLPSTSPPPLSEDGQLDFVIPDDETASTTKSVMTDVVEIHDKESVGDDGEVVRRRTIITLGPRSGSSGSINVTLVSSSSQTDLLESVTKDELQYVPPTKLFVSEPETIQKRQQDSDNAPRSAARPGTVSAFNARRTIEQRRQHQAQQQQQHQNRPTVPVAAKEEPPAPEVPLANTTKARTPPSSTYLYGEFGSPSSSSISIRTMSISMSFDDLESNNSSSAGTGGERRAGGRRSEAWYERRQSYGFEAADKLQSLLNTSGSSDVPSGVSRSCDSLSSTVRSTSSQLEKMIPPWIKNQSPVSNTSISKLQDGSTVDLTPEPPEASRILEDESSRKSTQLESVPDPEDTSLPPSTPTPSLQRSESSRSASQLLDGEAEPVWLRDLKVRRSLRETRRKPEPAKADSAAKPSEPIWLGVKLRPAGLLNLINPETTTSTSSPTKTSSYTPIFSFTNSGPPSEVQLPLLRKTSRDSLLVADEPKVEEKSASVPEQTQCSSVKEETMPTPPKTTIIKVHREEENVSSTKTSGKLHHHRSIELMQMLEDTPHLVRTAKQQDALETASTLDDIASVYSVATECSSTLASAMNSNEDLTRKVVKKVAFGKDVKEESDQKRSRPRRIRSRSPEARLRLWQEKLEEANKVIVIDPKSNNAEPSKVAFTRFGDDNQRPKASEPEPCQQPTTSETFRSLLHARIPYVVMHQQGKLIESNRSKYMASSITSPESACKPQETAADPPLRKTSTVVNGIVNFDSSIEQTITVLESETTQILPAPKSILKKRSMENLLDPEPILRPPTPFDTNPSDTNNNSGHSVVENHQPRIKVIMTNQTNSHPPAPSAPWAPESNQEEQEVLPWRIHLKHVDPPLVRAKTPDPVEPFRPPWVSLMMERKKTPPSAGVRPRTPEDFFRPEKTSSSVPVPKVTPSSTPVLGVPTAVEIIRKIRQKTPPASALPSAPVVMMVARCEVKESTTYPRPLQQEPVAEPAKAGDLGYHSLEGVSSVPEAGVKINSRKEPSIDETIARLNQTIEEIRSVENVARMEPSTRTYSPIGRRSVSPEKETRFSPKRDVTPPMHRSRETISPGKGHNGYAGSAIVDRTERIEGRRTSFESRTSPVRYGVEKEKSVSPSRTIQVHKDESHQVLETRTFYQSSSQVTHSGVRSLSTSAVPSGSPVLSAITNVRKSSFNESSSLTRSPYAPRADLTSGEEVTVTTIKDDRKERKFVVEADKDHQDDYGNASVKPATAPVAVTPHHAVLANLPEAEASVGQLVSKFESSSTTTSASESTMSYHAQQTKTVVTKESSQMNSRQQVQSIKTQTGMQLSHGMPEDKAALLVRKFFSNDLSILEPAKKSRKANPCAETIVEESSNSEPSETSSRRRTVTDENVKLCDDPTSPRDTSLDSDDLFRAASVATTDLLSCSSVGSALDLLTDDDRSIRTTSSVATLTQRYSSCSERSVKLSDIINFTRSTNAIPKVEEDPSMDDSNPASDTISQSASITASESASLVATTEETRSTASVVSESVSRHSNSRHPQAAKPIKTGNSVQAGIKEPLPRVRDSKVRKTSDVTPSAVNSQQRRTSTTSKSSTDSVKTTSKQPIPPIRPTRSSTTKMPSTRMVLASSKISSAKAVRPTAPPERKLSTTSTASRATRLVTITSYSSRGSPAKPEEAVTGIRETPVAVSAGHYKIRRDQRIPFTVPTSKTSSTAARLQRTATSSTAVPSTTTKGPVKK